MAEESKGQMMNHYGCVCYSITGESNAGDSRPASPKPSFHTGHMSDVYGEGGEKHGSGFSGGK